MPIALIDKAVAALSVLNLDHLENVPPAERRRLADICKHVAALAEPKAERPRSGILAALQDRES